MADEQSRLGDQIRSARKRCGLGQQQLADLSGVSLSLICKLEQGERETARTETVRKLAVAMEVPTSVLLGPVPQQEYGRETPGAAHWAPVREAIIHPQRTGTLEPVTERGLTDALLSAVKLYHDNQYDQLARILPGLIADSHDAPPLLRSRVLQLAGSLLVQARQRATARAALDKSLADAEATGSILDAASAVITQCWLLLLERQFEQVRHLAAQWADRIEPRMSTATVRELSVWGCCCYGGQQRPLGTTGQTRPPT